MINHNLYYRTLIFFVAVVALFAPALRSSSLQVSPESLKAALSVVGISLLLLLWSLTKIDSNVKTVAKSAFYYPVIGFLLWCAVTLFWVIDSYLASVQLVQFVSVGVVFFLVLNSVRSIKEIEGFLFLVILVSAAVSILGWLQFLFPENDLLSNLVRAHTATASTFGNKNMASHYVAMTLPISFVFFLKATDVRRSLLFFLITIVGTGFLIITYTRAGLLSIIVELIFIMGFILYSKFKHGRNKGSRKVFYKRSILLTFITVVIFLGSVSYISTDASFLSKFTDRLTLTKDKILSIKNQTEALNNPRIAPWKNTFELIKENPLVGVGIGQWPAYYPLYYDRVEKDQKFNEKIRLRHLHNDYLELLANVGVVGVSFLLWLFFLTIQAVHENLRDSDSEVRYISLALTLGLIGFSVSAMFSFPVKVYYPMMLVMVYIALIANINIRSTDYYAVLENASIPVEWRGSSVNKHYNLGYIKVTQFLCLVVTVVACTVSYKWLMGEHYFNLTQGIELAKYDDPAEKSQIKLQTIEKSIISNPYNPKAQFIAAQVLLENNYYDEGVEYLEKSLKGSPYQTLTLRSLFLAYASKNDLKNMQKVVEKYIGVDPRSVRAHAYATAVYRELGRPEDAKRVYLKMKENYLYFKGRNGFGPYYSEVGGTAQAVGDIKYAKEVFAEAIKKFKNDAELHKKLGGLYYLYPKNKKEKSKGVDLIKKSLKINPKIVGNKEMQQLIDRYEKRATRRY